MQFLFISIVVRQNGQINFIDIKEVFFLAHERSVRLECSSNTRNEVSMEETSPFLCLHGFCSTADPLVWARKAIFLRVVWYVHVLARLLRLIPFNLLSRPLYVTQWLRPCAAAHFEVVSIVVRFNALWISQRISINSVHPECYCRATIHINISHIQLYSCVSRLFPFQWTRHCLSTKNGVSSNWKLPVHNECTNASVKCHRSTHKSNCFALNMM